VPQFLIPAVVIFLHNLFTAAWIGGMMALLWITLPAARRALPQGASRQAFVSDAQKRLSVLATVSMIGLAITGVLLSRRSPLYAGPLAWSNTYSILLSVKHVLVIGMVALGLWRRYRQWPSGKPDSVSIARRSVLLLQINVALGIIVLLISGVMATISSAPPPMG